MNESRTPPNAFCDICELPKPHPGQMINKDHAGNWCMVYEHHLPRAKRDDKTLKEDLSYLMERMPLAKKHLNARFKFGADKHGRLNWRESLNTEHHDAWADSCKASLSRHYNAFMDGEDFDEDGLLHLTGIAWNALCLIEYEHFDEDKDPR